MCSSEAEARREAAFFSFFLVPKLRPFSLVPKLQFGNAIAGETPFRVRGQQQIDKEWELINCPLLKKIVNCEW